MADACVQRQRRAPRNSTAPLTIRMRCSGYQPFTAQSPTAVRPSPPAVTDH